MPKHSFWEPEFERRHHSFVVVNQQRREWLDNFICPPETLLPIHITTGQRCSLANSFCSEMPYAPSLTVAPRPHSEILFLKRHNVALTRLAD